MRNDVLVSSSAAWRSSISVGDAYSHAASLLLSPRSSSPPLILDEGRRGIRAAMAKGLHAVAPMAALSAPVSGLIYARL